MSDEQRNDLRKADQRRVKRLSIIDLPMKLAHSGNSWGWFLG